MEQSSPGSDRYGQRQRTAFSRPFTLVLIHMEKILFGLGVELERGAEIDVRVIAYSESRKRCRPQYNAR